MTQIHVNLCDLLDSTRRRSQVKVFRSDIELREYTLRTGNIFPLEKAYAGGLLKYLLREITGEYHGNRSRGGRRKGEKTANRKAKDKKGGQKN